MMSFNKQYTWSRIWKTNPPPVFERATRFNYSSMVQSVGRGRDPATPALLPLEYPFAGIL